MMYLNYLKLKLTNPNAKMLIYPSLLLVLLVTMLIFTLTKGYSQVDLQSKKLKRAKEERSTLREKLSLLQEVNQKVLEVSDKSVIALPNINSSLLMVSQIKGLTTEASGLSTPSEFGTSPFFVSVEGVESGKVSFQVNASNVFQLIDLLERIGKTAPISTINTVEMKTVTTHEFEADVTLSVYWSKFPENIPAIPQTLSDLTSKEKELLALISDLEEGDLLSVSVKPSEPFLERVSPFE